MFALHAKLQTADTSLISSGEFSIVILINDRAIFAIPSCGVETSKTKKFLKLDGHTQLKQLPDIDPSIGFSGKRSSVDNTPIAGQFHGTNH